MNIFNLLSSFSSIFWAAFLFVLAFAVAQVAKGLVIKALKKLKAEEFLNKAGIKDVETQSSIDFFGKLVFVIVFLMFLPAILSRLGISEVASPIYGIIDEFFNYIPKIVIAGIILVVGIAIAKVVRQLSAALLVRVKIDVLQEKAGISEESTKLSTIISYIIYVLVLIPIVIAALQALDISAITNPVLSMMSKVFDMVPNIFISVAIVIVGFYIAKTVAKLLQNIISGTGFDAAAGKLFTNKQFSASGIIAESVKYIIIVLFVVEALSSLKLAVLASVGNTILAYLPAVISTVIIIGAALFISNWVKELILKKNAAAKCSAQLARVSIITVSVFMSLSQLKIAPSIVNAAFIIILSGLALAFALAVGLGFKDFIVSILKKNEAKNNTQQLKNKIEEVGNMIADAFDK